MVVMTREVPPEGGVKRPCLDPGLSDLRTKPMRFEFLRVKDKLKRLWHRYFRALDIFGDMAREAPGSLESLRARNRARALGVLARRGAASQADIVRETGLSRTTVSSLVADLVREGVVVERADSARPASSPGGGRPATLLSLEPSSGGFVGVAFGG